MLRSPFCFPLLRGFVAPFSLSTRAPRLSSLTLCHFGSGTICHLDTEMNSALSKSGLLSIRSQPLLQLQAAQREEQDRRAAAAEEAAAEGQNRRRTNLV